MSSNLKRPVNVGVNLLQCHHKVFQAVVVRQIGGGKLVKVCGVIVIGNPGPHTLPVEAAITTPSAIWEELFSRMFKLYILIRPVYLTQSWNTSLRILFSVMPVRPFPFILYRSFWTSQSGCMAWRYKHIILCMCPHEPGGSSAGWILSRPRSMMLQGCRGHKLSQSPDQDLETCRVWGMRVGHTWNDKVQISD